MCLVSVGSWEENLIALELTVAAACRTTIGYRVGWICTTRTHLPELCPVSWETAERPGVWSMRRTMGGSAEVM